MKLKKLFILVILFTFIDQITKIAVSLNMHVNSSINIIPNFFDITYVLNTGAAFSIFKGARFIFIIISIIMLNLIYIYFIKDKQIDNKKQIIYSILISGILGNMIDRIMYGYVIDFLHFHILNFDFAIFNVADIFIVLSILLLIVGDDNVFKKRRRK